jgi:hypothetical protein
VLELQEMLHDRPHARADLAVQAAAHVLDLLDYVLQVELGEAAREKQVHLGLGPGVEIALVEIARPCLDSGRHPLAPYRRPAGPA